MKTSRIRQIINAAHQQEAKTHQLESHIARYMKTLHGSVEISASSPSSVLLAFIERYIYQVPEFIDTVRVGAEAAGIGAFVEPYLRISEDFFLVPPAVMHGHFGLEAILDEAYLAHRLIEELNDVFICEAACPLVPMDTTQANVVVHSLIGDDFANQLDEAIEVIVSQLKTKREAFKTDEFHTFLRLHGQRWRSICSEWPCLARDMGLNITQLTKIPPLQAVSA